eukprot:159264-Chlamydomonas_euryale.AAC.1
MCVCVKLQLLTALPPLAKWIRRGQPAHTSPQQPPGSERTRRHKGRKRTGRNNGKPKEKGRKGEKRHGNGPEEAC